MHCLHIDCQLPLFQVDLVQDGDFVHKANGKTTPNFTVYMRSYMVNEDDDLIVLIIVDPEFCGRKYVVLVKTLAWRL